MDSRVPARGRAGTSRPAQGGAGALINADAKLGAYGPQLGYPHTSAVHDADRLRELRPRAGRSAWRALYRQVGEVFVVAAVGPEARSDPRGFERAVRRALQRLADLEEG